MRGLEGGGSSARCPCHTCVSGVDGVNSGVDFNKAQAYGD